MHRLHRAGLALLAFGLLGYGIGVVRAYPGRAFSLTAIMVGLTALGIHRLERAEGS